MDARTPSPASLASDLSSVWANSTAWRILDTQFSAGAFFLATWKLWQDDANRPPILHMVALAPTAPAWAAVASQAGHGPGWQSLLDELKPHWFGLLPGFHRLSLSEGRVLLTLCIGDKASLLRQQHFFADTVYLGGDTVCEHEEWDTWDTWDAKTLARYCRRGTRLILREDQTHLTAVLTQCGFVFDSNAQVGQSRAVFDPRWSLKTSRNPSIPVAIQPGTCAIIGAGLAGASVAASLAKRGWQVVVLDTGVAPASGASGLPVGLLAPHGSADDCKLSRLSRAGVRLMLGEATRLLKDGEDWALTGSVEYRIDGSTGQPDNWPIEGVEWSQSVPPTPLEPRRSVRHAKSAWIKPTRLIGAWLSRPNITFQPNAHAATLVPKNGQWSVVNDQGHEWVCADRVVFANAAGALPLLQQVQLDLPQLMLQLDRLPQLHGVRGQLSFARHATSPQATFPLTPINGAGSVIPSIPTDDGLTWYTGSSFQPDTQAAHSPDKNHRANFDRLQKLRPELAMQLKPQFDALSIHHWAETRCVTSDRLPIVGPVGDAQNASLWVCAGMGSRGLSFSVLCAELLAAQWGGEPLPIELNLAQSFEAVRASRSTIG